MVFDTIIEGTCSVVSVTLGRDFFFYNRQMKKIKQRTVELEGIVASTLKALKRKRSRTGAASVEGGTEDRNAEMDKQNPKKKKKDRRPSIGESQSTKRRKGGKDDKRYSKQKIVIQKKRRCISQNRNLCSDVFDTLEAPAACRGPESLVSINFCLVVFDRSTVYSLCSPSA